jgi:hypothetical protein
MGLALMIASIVASVVQNDPQIPAQIKSIATAISSALAALVKSGVTTSPVTSTSILAAIQGVMDSLKAVQGLPANTAVTYRPWSSYPHSFLCPTLCYVDGLAQKDGNLFPALPRVELIGELDKRCTDGNPQSELRGKAAERLRQEVEKMNSSSCDRSGNWLKNSEIPAHVTHEAKERYNRCVASIQFRYVRP